MSIQGPGIEKFDRLNEKGRSKVDEICRQAVTVFGEKGFASASLDDVCRATGISKGALFHYFSTKEELLFLTLCRHMDLLLDGLKDELEAISSPYRKIRFLIKRHIELSCKNLNASRLILNESKTLSTGYWKILRSKNKEYLDLWRSSIGDFFEGRNVSHEKLTVATFSLLGMCNWIAWWYDPYGPVPPEELAETIFKIFTGLPDL